MGVYSPCDGFPVMLRNFPWLLRKKMHRHGSQTSPAIFGGMLGGCWSICCISQDIFTGSPEVLDVLAIASGSVRRPLPALEPRSFWRKWSRPFARPQGEDGAKPWASKIQGGIPQESQEHSPSVSNLCMLITSYNQFQTNLDGWRVFPSQRSTEELSLPIALMLSSKDYCQYSGMVVCPEIGNPQPSLAMWSMMDYDGFLGAIFGKASISGTTVPSFALSNPKWKHMKTPGL